MAIDLQELGRKCWRLRAEVLQMPLDEAASRAGMAEDRLEAIEAGEVEPTGDEVLILADVYDEPVDYFVTNERSASIEKASDLYRMYGSSFTPEDRQSVQQFLKLCRMEHEIEGLLGERPRVVSFQRGRQHSHFKTDGRLAAEKLRSDLDLGDSPVTNPFHLARRFGCHVFRRSLRNSGVSGLMLRHEDYGPCILVNYDEDPYRQNFSAAHELCHAILDGDCEVTVTFDDPNDEGIEDRKKREWRASSFAAHLLFPSSVRQAMPLGNSDDDRVRAIQRAAEVFNVNTVVILIALKEAERISAQDEKRLRPRLKVPRSSKADADLSGEPSRTRERREAYLKAGLSPEYVEVCVRGYREGQISLGRLADAVLASPVDLPLILSTLDLGELHAGTMS